MSRILFILFLTGLSTNMSGQLNVTFRSSVNYNESLNDIWGYADGNGEYALVGMRNGVNVVDVTDPDNPVDLGTPTGPSSTWRDIKTWGSYAFVTNETSDGILVINLGNLPTPLTANDWYYLSPDVPGEGTITDCHNIHIDEFGYAYLTGCNLNGGGTLIFDVDTTPGQMAYAGKTPPIYAHDSYTVDNRLYTSDIYAGEFSIYDVSDKNNVTFINSQTTESEFTHNVWINDAHTVAFTTDERANAPVGAYDISDPQNIVELDQFKPIETLGDGVIPHNVHVWNDWLIISYYTDGCIIVDGSKPDNLIEVGNFDTFIPASTGFDGVWGAYPFLPSGTILCSDIGNGLYVLSPTYVRACWLEGKITDESTGDPIQGAAVNIDADQANLSDSDFAGDYQTGLATAGTYSVTYSALGYESKVVTVDLDNGVEVIQDVQLTPLSSIGGSVIRSGNGEPIENAQVRVVTATGSIFATSNGDGIFEIPGLSDGIYEVYVGAWGYNLLAQQINLSPGSSASFILEPGYEDDFVLDLGWDSNGTAASGTWEIGEPLGTTYQGEASNPDFDIVGDIGDQCYVTGNGGGGAGNDDVDDGWVTLTSPLMDLTDYDLPIIEFSYWFFNAGGNNNPNDNLQIMISNGLVSTQVALIETNAQWTSFSFQIEDFVVPNETVQIQFITSDLADSGHLVEAAIDGFSVKDASNSGVYPEFTSSALEGCAPLSVTYSDPSDSTITRLWNFPGGTPSQTMEANPTVVYDNPGIYSASLEASVQSGAVYTITQNSLITVEGPPEVSFSFGTDNTTVSFSANISNATSYVYDFGDGSNSFELNPTHEYTEGGTYTVTLSAANDCGTETFEQDITVMLSNIFDPQSESRIQAYPNPFTDNFTVEYEIGNATRAKVSIANSQGKILLSRQLENQNGNLQLGDQLSPGVYFIGLNIDGRVTRHLKLVKI
ncbi:MAG: choice-of-anchor B family protein [Saprospiraceae bacterium]|nr:choice-of-anchor B family protein [Saprospiraceae bacterium]